MSQIIATIGPSSLDYRILKEMHNSGMNIARINTKYGTIKQHEEIINKIRKLKKCRILLDIKGEEKINWIKKQKFDYLAVSFTETKEQLKKIRSFFLPKKIKIISKIETKKGVKKIDSIINASEGVMVARGDLGVNIPFEELPIKQKIIIKRCNKKNKFVITATEMLLSMMQSTVPKRSEASDVANAVLDGSDALMLSEETAIGKHPILVVKTMKKIIDSTQKNKKFLEK